MSWAVAKISPCLRPHNHCAANNRVYTNNLLMINTFYKMKGGFGVSADLTQIAL